MENNTLTFEQMPYHTFEDIENLEYTLGDETEETRSFYSKNVLFFWKLDNKIFVTIGMFEKWFWIWDEDNECEVTDSEPRYHFMPLSSEDITTICYPPSRALNLRTSEFAFMLLDGNVSYDTHPKMSWPVNIYSE